MRTAIAAAILCSLAGPALAQHTLPLGPQVSAPAFEGVRLPGRSYTPGTQIMAPDPWGRPMRLLFMSFAAPQFSGSVFLQIQDDPNGLPADSRITANSFGHAGAVVLVWQDVIDPSGHVIWRRRGSPGR